MPNRQPKTFTNFVTVPLSDDQLARLDAREGKRAAVLRAALDAYVASDTSDQPDGWTLAGINTDMLRQLQERAARLQERNADLAGQLHEYAAGGRHGVVLEEGERYVYRDGELVIDTRPLRRTVQHRAE
jgi:hypothetical protein